MDGLAEIALQFVNSIAWPAVLIALVMIYERLNRIEERVNSIDIRLARVEGKMNGAVTQNNVRG